MPKTVVLIDDDPDDLYLIKEAITLVRPDFVCFSFIYPEEAVRLLSMDTVLLPDYIFLDINMPKKNGKECLVEFRKVPELANTAIIILSTSMPAKTSQDLLSAGANFTYQKPNRLSGYEDILRQIFN